MKKAAAAIAIAGSLATLGVYHMNAEDTDLYDVTTDTETEFQSYTAKHGKSYGTKAEYKFRLGVFAKSKAFIEKFNSQRNANDTSAESLGLNYLADWTPEEYQKLLGYKPLEDIETDEEQWQDVEELHKKPDHHKPDHKHHKHHKHHKPDHKHHHKHHKPDHRRPHHRHHRGKHHWKPHRRPHHRKHHKPCHKHRGGEGRRHHRGGEGRRHHRGGEGRHHGGGEGRRHHRGGRHLEETTAAPDAIDWRTLGAVTKVKNQGSCGSCWAFSTTGGMEGRWFTSNKQLVSLSEQQFVDCSKNDQNAGCQGGLMDSAFKYAEATPIETESQYPYKGVNGKCAAAGGKIEVKSYQDVTANDPKALQAAVAEGPVSVAIDAGSIFFQLYFGGVMKLYCGTSLDHGVLVVGYGSEAGWLGGTTDYWILKNSWGGMWGEKGYFRMVRNMDKTGPGFCGLQKQASYPIF